MGGLRAALFFIFVFHIQKSIVILDQCEVLGLQQELLHTGALVLLGSFGIGGTLKRVIKAFVGQFNTLLSYLSLLTICMSLYIFDLHSPMALSSLRGNSYRVPCRLE